MPPSLAAIKPQMMFLGSFKQLILNKYYWIHFFGSSVSIGYFLVLAVNTTLILCPLGFGRDFSSIYSISIEVVSGLIAGLMISFFLQKTNRFLFYNSPLILWTARILLIVYVCNVWLIMVAFTTRMASVGYSLTLPAFIILGVTGMPLLPICYELAVETSFPVGQATSTGLIWIFGQAWAFIFTFIINGLITTEFPVDWGVNYQNQTMIDENVNVCETGGAENNFYYKTPLIVLAVISTVFMVVWIVFMRCEFLRRNSD